MKYPIDPSLRRFARLPVPLFRALFPMANFWLRHLSKQWDTKRVHVQCIQQDSWTMHMLTPRGLDDQDLPCLYFLHGGGFVYAAAPHHRRMLQEYCLAASCKAVVMDYRLAPRHVHPAAMNDCIEGYRYLLDHAKDMHIDASRIMLAGDSAGGFLALEVAHHAQQEKLPYPCGCMLLYPVVDPSMSSSSMQRYLDTPLWNARYNKKMWNWYRKGAPLESPLTYASTLPIPSIYLEVAEFDCLRDEGIALHHAFAPASPIQFQEILGAYHGYDVVAHSPLTMKAKNQRIQFLKDGFILRP